MRVFYRSASQS